MTAIAPQRMHRATKYNFRWRAIAHQIAEFRLLEFKGIVRYHCVPLTCYRLLLYSYFYDRGCICSVADAAVVNTFTKHWRLVQRSVAPNCVEFIRSRFVCLAGHQNEVINRGEVSRPSVQLLRLHDS